MPNFINLPSFTEDGDVCVVVETPRGSRVKFDYDPKQKTFTLSKSLLTGLTYPIIGILEIEQKSKGKTERNDRLFAVPRDSHSEQALKDVSDLSKPIREELEKFFKATDELEDKKLNILGWKGPKSAVEAIKEAAKSFKKKGK